jgi:alpha-galactosidase
MLCYRANVLKLCRIVVSLIVGGAVSAGCAATSAPGPPPQTPPMGWNSWNSGIPLTEQSIKATIDAMAGSGMRDAGYRYAILDAGWAAPSRDAAGNLRADPDRFPGGIAALARYAHDRDMLLGLYASPHNQICGQDPSVASAGHEIADARTFAAWGVDYLKYDWCRTEADHADQVKVFTAMRDALRASGRRTVYSINPNSSADLTAGSRYDWSAIADLTRNTVDLLPVWDSASPVAAAGSLSSQGFTGVREQLAAAAPVAGRSRPGKWNDPDMLVVGIPWAQFVSGHLGMLSSLAVPGTLTAEQLEQVDRLLPVTPEVVALVGAQRPNLSDEEQRAHFSLWAMLAAPLIAGNDVRSMSEQTRAILTNPDVVAVDQDPLVIQGKALPADGRVMVKPLADGSVAVAMFNPDSQPVSIAISATTVGLTDAPCYTIRDVWTHSAGNTSGNIDSGTIPVHGVVLLRVTPGATSCWG